MMKSRRGSRGLSPIFATLILIAIAVIAGIVVYMFTSGTIAAMTGGGTAGQEKVAIQSASYGTGAVTILAQSTGGPLPPTTGLNIIVHTSSGAVAGSNAAVVADGDTWGGGALVSISSTITLASGTYTASLITPAGGNFISPAFTIP